MTGTIQIEVWKSDHNREERHYFLHDGAMHGYQKGEYLFGVNPHYFDQDAVRMILGILQYSRAVQK